jgi:hypothetical protein
LTANLLYTILYRIALKYWNFGKFTDLFSHKKKVAAKQEIKKATKKQNMSLESGD